MNAERIGLIVWLTDVKNNRRLERIGNLVYISKKLKYAIIYINKDEYEEVTNRLEKLDYVKKVERSLVFELVEHFSDSLVTKEN